ncbi:MAG: O-methyltransferase [Alphaproteobacteria bacterium]
MPEDLLRLPPAVERWRRADAARRHPVLARLEEATQALAERTMQTDAAQAELLGFLVELTGARRVVEVGTFTGYGALAMALALPDDGRLITLDTTDWDGLGDRHWAEAGVAHRIERRLGLAEESLDALLAGPEAGRVDLVYVDADKTLYPRYLEQARGLVRPGGLIAMDNLFWGGAVAEQGDDDTRQVEALRRTARAARDDAGLAMTLVPIADGLLLLRRR